MSTLPKLFVARSLPDALLAPARDVAEVDVWPDAHPPSASELVLNGRGADVILSTITERLDASLLDRMPRLIGISNLAVGVDNIDLTACRRRNITVANTPGVLANSVAELTITLMLMAMRRVGEATAALRTGAWGEWEPYWMCGRDVSGRMLGLVGSGAIGRRVAQLGESIGMYTAMHSRTSGPTLDEVLAVADVVSLHVPLTRETHHLIGREQLARMKPGSVLINTSRGPVVDEAALIAALRDGHLAAAGLDVTTIEPLPLDHPFHQMPNVIVTPHIGSATTDTRDRMVRLAVEHACAMLTGGTPRHVVHEASRPS